MRRWATRLGALAVPVMLVIGWVLFAPAQVGGRATYLMTEGVSMLPTYHGGDLVVLRREATYEVGDVIAYADPNIGEIFHRIVGREGDRFVMKGDNNPHEDVYRPAVADILGRLWLQIPGGGNVLLMARQPPVAATLSGGAVGLAMIPVTGKLRGRRRLLRKENGGGPAQRPPGDGGTASLLGPIGQVTVALTALVTVLAIAGMVLAFSQPLDRRAKVTLPYTQSGQFQYAADNAPIGLYDSGTAKTGDPVYRKLTPDVVFSFDYRFTSTLRSAVSGTASLSAQLRAPNGWTRSVELQGPEQFTGTSTVVKGTLDLNRIQSIIDVLHQQIGASANDSERYDLDIVPRVSVSGTLGSSPMATTYAPSLQLQYQSDQLWMPAPSTAATGTATANTEPSTAGVLDATVEEPNRLDLIVLNPEVATVRLLTFIEIPGAALLMILLVILGMQAKSANESVRIQAQYSHMLVALRGSAISDSGQTFDVETMEDLVRVAVREGRMILHETRSSDHTYYVREAEATYFCCEHIYYVQDADATYRYRTVDRPVNQPDAVPEAVT